jgi:predicted RNA-binding protein
MPFGINYQLMAILTKRSYRFVSIAGRCQVAVVRKHFEKHCNPTLLQKRYLNEDSSSLPDLQETKKQKTVTEIYSTIPSKSRNDRNAITDFIRDYPYGGGALDAVKEEVRQELEEFKTIITAEPPERAIIHVDPKEGEITVFDWWRNEAEYFPRLGKLL